MSAKTVTPLPTPVATFTIIRVGIPEVEIAPWGFSPLWDQSAHGRLLGIPTAEVASRKILTLMSLWLILEGEKRVTVAPGASEGVAFTVVNDQRGEYNVVVGGLGGNFNVAELGKMPPVKLLVNWPLISGIFGGDSSCAGHYIPAAEKIRKIESWLVKGVIACKIN